MFHYVIIHFTTPLLGAVVTVFIIKNVEMNIRCLHCQSVLQYQNLEVILLGQSHIICLF